MKSSKPQFVGEKVKLGSLIKPAKVERCGKQGYPILSITKDDGIVLQSTKFKKRIASKDTASYKVVPRGKLIQGIHIDEANFAIQNLVDWGIVSPAYKVWDIDTAIADPEYLALALRSESSLAYYRQNLVGTVHRRGRMSNEVFYRLEVNLPSLQVQKRILAILGDAASQIAYAQQQIAQLDSLVKSRFVEMFGRAEDEHSDFPVKTLDDVCVSIVRGPFGSALKKELFVPKGPGVYKVYEQKHAIQKRVDIGTYYISSDRFKTLKRFECYPGDILMSCSGTMGRLYQLPPNCEPGVMNQALCKFTLSDSILVDYFLGFMEQVVDELGAKGSGIKNVSSVKFIKAIRIPLPPVELQGRFADFVAQVDKSRFAWRVHMQLRVLML